MLKTMATGVEIEGHRQLTAMTTKQEGQLGVKMTGWGAIARTAFILNA